MNRNIIKLILILIVQAAVFIIIDSMVEDTQIIDKEVNAAYYEFVDQPEKFIVCKAKITEHFEPEGLESTEVSQCTVEFALGDGKTVTAQVLEDVGKNKVGDEIEVAYENNERAIKNGYINVTQLYFIENKKKLGLLKGLKNADIVLAVIISVIFIGRSVKKY